MKRFLYLRGRGRSWASRVSLPGMPARVRVGPDRERAAAMCSKVSVGLSVPIGMLCLPRESGADLNFVFFRIYANTLPTQSAVSSFLSQPSGAQGCLSYLQSSGMSLGEQRRVGMRAESRLNCCGPPDVMLLRPASILLARRQGLPGCHRPFQLSEGRGL